MAELFDDISRIVGSQIPRRKALRLISSAFVGAALGITVKGRTHSPAAPNSYSICCQGLGGVCYQTQPEWADCDTRANSEVECDALGVGHHWYPYGVKCNDILCCKTGETCCGELCCPANVPCINGECCTGRRPCLGGTKCCTAPRTCINGTLCCDASKETIMPDGTCCPDIRVCRVNNTFICCPAGQPCCSGTFCCDRGCDTYGRCNNPTPARP
jgi:hypothetical protein